MRCLLSLLSSLIVLALIASPAHGQEIDVTRDLPLMDLRERATEIYAEALRTQEHEGWHVARLANPGEAAMTLRVASELRQPGRVSVYFEPVGAQPRPVFDVAYPFSRAQTRASQGRVAVSDPIVIQPGASALIYFSVDTRNQETQFPLSLRTELQQDAFLARRHASHSAYFGGYLVFVVFFVFFSILLRFKPAWLYAVYLTALTVLFFHSHGYFHTLFEGASAWLYFPSIRILQIGVMLAYLSFARAFLGTRQRHPRLHNFITWYLAASAVLALCEFLFWAPLFVLIVDAMAAIFILLGSLIAYLAVRDRLEGAWFFAAGYTILILVGYINWFASLPGSAGLNVLVDQATMVLQTVDAIVFAGAMVRQTFAIRHARDASLSNEIALTREKLALAESLLHAERQREAATDLAEVRRQRLAEASHDLRQPLTTLKLALNEIEASAPAVAEKLGVSLDYLGDLLRNTLDETRPGDDRNRSAKRGEGQAIPVSLILANLERMFAAEAHAKGLAFTTVPSRLSVDVPPMALIRAMANLTSNAIRYTREGGVLIGARRRGETVTLEVWDTGPGMEAGVLAAIQAPYVRGSEDGEGEGLGLAIAAKLAAEAGFALRCRSWPGQGSCFSLTGLKRSMPEPERIRPGSKIGVLTSG